MRVQRHFTKAGGAPYGDIEFESATTEIRNPDGFLVFGLDGFMVPRKWSQVARDILA